MTYSNMTDTTVDNSNKQPDTHPEIQRAGQGSCAASNRVSRNRVGRGLRQAPLAIAMLATLASLSTTANAADRRVATARFTEYAQVVNVEPVYREVRLREPSEQCWVDQERQVVGYEKSVPNRRYESASHGHSGGAIVGGIIGGVIGNQLGRGSSRSGRTGATVAGAIIGSAIGNEGNHSDRYRRHRRGQSHRQVQSRPIYETRPVERCKRVIETRREQQLQHYNVTYRYKGRTFTTQMPRDPGNRLELQVSVAPARQ